MEKFENKYSKEIKLLSSNIRQDRKSRKPLIPHLLRVGKYLYKKGYSEDIVIAGLLHDLIEWTDNPEKIIKDKYSKHIYDIVLVNTKDRTIIDPVQRRIDYINRCAKVGIDALIVKAADTLDSYKFYKKIKDDKEIERSRDIAKLILKKVKINDDPIFKKLNKIN